MLSKLMSLPPGSLACGRAIAVAGGKGTCGHGAEQNGVGERGEEDGAGDGFHHPLRQQGMLAVELRRGAGKTRTAHLVPWGQIFQSYNAGKAGVPIQEIEVNAPLERKKGAYRISRLDIVRISGYYDLALQNATLQVELAFQSILQRSQIWIGVRISKVQRNE
jgi:hypothetical protein